MHFLEIATTQPCLQNSVYTFRWSESLFNKKFVYGNEKRVWFSWNPSYNIPGKAKNFNFRRVEAFRAGLSIAAVATTLERALVTESNESQSDYKGLRMDIDSSSSTSSATEQPFLNGDSAELGEREKLRRLRISKANEGNTPWNKGRKHSPETLRRIRERTRLAMQDPKVKMKLVNMGHAQSEETRVKIGLGVRIGWEKRREKLMLQETCYYQWQNLIAEASRKGLLGEEELQWDSYKILDEQLEEEWLQSVEQRKKMPRPKGSKRAPKSPEQRKKISEAIAAKWADPEYRSRVYSGLAKYHGIQPGVERKPKRKTSGDGETKKRSPPKKKVDNLDESGNLKNQVKRMKLKRSKVPKFKDPLASSKLEMLKSIRAQRAAAENSKSEAVARARALIAEATKAAKALEAAAEKSPLAQASLIETRKLIAEATQSIEYIENAQLDWYGNGSSSDVVTPSDEAESGTEGVNEPEHIKVNGTPIIRASTSNIDDLGFNKSGLHDMLNGSGDQLLGLSSMNYDLLDGEEDLSPGSTDHDSSAEELNNMVKHSNFSMQRNDPEVNESEQEGNSQLPNGTEAQSKGEEPPKSTAVTKKWVRGRLVEVGED